MAAYAQRFLDQLVDRFTLAEFKDLCFDLSVDYDSLPGEGEGKASRARELVIYLAERGRIDELIRICARERPDFEDWGARIVILARPETEPDGRLAAFLAETLTGGAHAAALVETDADRQDVQLEAADFVVPLLSAAAVADKGLPTTVQRANAYRTLNQRPLLLPVRVAGDETAVEWPATLAEALLDTAPIAWTSVTDNASLVEGLAAAIAATFVPETVVVREGEDNGGGDVHIGRMTGGRVTVTNIIQSAPQLWQVAGRFVRDHPLFVAVVTVLLVGLFLLWLPYRDLYRIRGWYWLLTAAALVAGAWGAYAALRRAPGARSSRRLGLTGASFVAVLGLVAFQGWRVANPPQLPPEAFGIVLADLSSSTPFDLGGTARRTTQTVFDDLCDEVRQAFNTAGDARDPCQRGSEPPPIVVQRTGSIRSVAEAEAYGSRVGAEIVIWGEVSNGRELAIDYKVLETLDQAVTPEFPLVLPVVSRLTEISFASGGLDAADTSAVRDLAAAVARFSLGVQAYLARDFPAAIRHLEAALPAATVTVREDNEGLSFIYYYLGDSYYRRRRNEDGLAMLARARELNPAEPAIDHNIALGYGILGDDEQRDNAFRSALRKLDNFLDTNRSDPTRQDQVAVALYDRGQIYEVLDKPANMSRAVNDLLAALEINPDFFAAQIVVSRLIFSLVELDDDQLAAIRLPDLKPSTRDRCRQQFPDLSLDGDLNDALLDCARAFMQRAIDIAEANQATTAINPAWAYLNLGDIEQRAGNVAEARAAYEKTIDLEPNDPLPYHMLAGLLVSECGLTAEAPQAQCEPDRAAALYDRLVEVADNRAWAYEQTGHFWRGQDNFSAAADAYERAIQNLEGDVDGRSETLLRTYLASTYQQGGDLDNARLNYERAVAREPEEYFLYASYGAFLEGLPGADQDEWQRAVEMYRQSLLFRPLDTFVLGRLSALSARLDQVDTAIAADACRAAVEALNALGLAAGDADRAAAEQCVADLLSG